MHHLPPEYPVVHHVVEQQEAARPDQQNREDRDRDQWRRQPWQRHPDTYQPIRDKSRGQGESQQEDDRIEEEQPVSPVHPQIAKGGSGQDEVAERQYREPEPLPGRAREILDHHVVPQERMVFGLGRPVRPAGDDPPQPDQPVRRKLKRADLRGRRPGALRALQFADIALMLALRRNRLVAAQKENTALFDAWVVAHEVALWVVLGVAHRPPVGKAGLLVRELAAFAQGIDREIRPRGSVELTPRLRYRACQTPKAATLPSLPYSFLGPSAAARDPESTDVHHF